MATLMSTQSGHYSFLTTLLKQNSVVVCQTCACMSAARVSIPYILPLYTVWTTQLVLCPRKYILSVVIAEHMEFLLMRIYSRCFDRFFMLFLFRCSNNHFGYSGKVGKWELFDKHVVHPKAIYKLTKDVCDRMRIDAIHRTIYATLYRNYSSHWLLPNALLCLQFLFVRFGNIISDCRPWIDG